MAGDVQQVDVLLLHGQRVGKVGLDLQAVQALLELGAEGHQLDDVALQEVELCRRYSDRGDDTRGSEQAAGEAWQIRSTGAAWMRTRVRALWLVSLQLLELLDLLLLHDNDTDTPDDRVSSHERAQVSAASVVANNSPPWRRTPCPMGCRGALPLQCDTITTSGVAAAERTQK